MISKLKTMGKLPYLNRKLKKRPVPERMNPTRTSFKARAKRTSLSYFSYMTGTRSMKRDNNMLNIAEKMAKPDKPARKALNQEMCFNQAKTTDMVLHPSALGMLLR